MRERRPDTPPDVPTRESPGIARRTATHAAVIAGAHRPAPRGPTRRQVLARGAGVAGAALLGTPLASALTPPPRRRTERVVLVIFGGGVRSRETIRSDNVPNLMGIASQGVLYPRTRVQNLGHYGSAVSILTGAWETFGIRENARPVHPTVFEIVRRDLGLPASAVWLATSGTDQETNYAHSSHDGYGARYGANLIGGEGLFNAELRDLLSGAVAQGPGADEREATLAALRGAIDTPLRAADGGGALNDDDAAARIEGYILDELRGGTADITGLGASDAKAMHVARNLLAVFRPRLLAVTLRAPDVAHSSFNDYVTAIRRNDEELGRLFTAITRDEELAATTALFVLPEFGRDRDFNERRGLDHGDDSDELLQVASVAWGPDFRQGRVEDREVSSTDVAPTIASLFGTRTGPGTGRVLPGLFA